MTGPLEGLLVVGLEQAVAAPYCTSRLADAGARVIKVERLEGDFARGYDHVAHGQSSYFVWLNRGKQSVTLDIKCQEDAVLLHRMLVRADVFVQNLLPGAAARAGFGSAELRACNERLITCDVSGYGEDGPYAHMKAYDLLVQAESGLASITGRAEGPGRVGVSVCDIAAGMYAYQAILEALLERQRTGFGASIKVSLFDAMAEWMTVPLLHQEHGGRAPERVGLAHPSIAPYGDFATRDGQRIVIAIQNEREWVALCTKVLANPSLATCKEFASNVERVKNRRKLDALIDAFFSARGRDDLIALLAVANIAYGELNSVEQLSHHPQLRRTHVATPGGEVSLPAPPARFVGTVRRLGSVPALGEHTSAIRREFEA